ncbi:uncharacterized protein LOC124915163 [Impatiens glandulifera]|uniref:uncharacterized protein LOC124915163 n=1 Tax=Impatiens glandulifera TaxID=253017 RepID=UPI001FB0BEB7|nr:uncharacterized protein LOC124915163 [Impatiens glandulifera]
MISVFVQERLLGAALGSIVTGLVVFEQRRDIYKSIMETQSQFAPETQVNQPAVKKRSELHLAHMWNKSIDQTFGALIEFTSSRGW